MKKTNRTHLLRTISKSGVTFFAVAFIAAVSIAIYHGFHSSSLAVLNHADNYFNENNLVTFEVACANGITEEDIAAMTTWEGVTAVEGGYDTSVRMQVGSDRISLMALSLLENINKPTVVAGTLPTAPDQLAIEELFATKRGVQVGDTVTLEHDGELLYDTYTVTAIINQPSYNCTRVKDARGKADVGLGANDFYITLLPEAFDTDYWSGCYTVAYVDSSVLDGIYYFDDAYAQAEADYLARLADPAAERAQNRFDSLSAEVKTKLNDAQYDLDKAAEDIAAGEAEIADAKQEIADGEKKLAEAKKEIEDGEKELADFQKEYETGKQDYYDMKYTLRDAKEIMLSKLAVVNPSMKPEDTLAMLTKKPDASPAGSLVASYLAAEAELEAAKLALEQAEKELTTAKADLASGKAELATSEAELAEGKAALAKAETKLTEGKADYAEAQGKFTDAQADAADIQLEEWVLSGRNDVGDVRGIMLSIDMMNGLSYAMSIVFLMVSAVVCYAAAVRMIDEQRVLLGAQKALGSTPGEIMLHFVLYYLLCSFLGILIGWVGGIVIVETMLLFIFKRHFLFGSIPLAFNWDSALLTAGICLTIFMVATLGTCTRLVSEPAINLLRGQTPTANKKRFFESWGVYRKMNLYNRTVIRNVLNDKSRMWTTIMGVVGCTSLLVSCLTLKMGIGNSSIRQFEEYFLYNHRLVVDTTVGNPADFATILDGCGVDYTLLQDKLTNFRPVDGKWDNAHVVAVTDTAEIGDFMVLEDVTTGQVTHVPERGVLVSRRMAERFALSAGSVVELMDENGLPRQVEVAGVMEHYIDYHLFVTSAGYYEEVMGKPVDNCVFLLKGDGDTLRPALKDLPGYLSLTDNSAFATDTSVHNLVIAICTALSATLALLVLLNQITMCINRKARELAVMRINGYTVAQTKAYIYKDNIVLTAIGLLLGCFFGCLLGYVDVRIIETGAARYVRDPNMLACLIACGICTAFAVAVNVIALKRIEKLSLTNVSSN